MSVSVLLIFAAQACTQKADKNESIIQETAIHSEAESNYSSVPEEVEKEIKATLIDMWDAIEKEDMERYSNYIHPDFTQFGEYDSILREGKKEEIEGIAAWVEQADNIHTEMLEPKVKVYGNVAWIVYYWKDYGITSSGTFSTRGKSTRIFVKEDKKWLCIHGHYTLLP